MELKWDKNSPVRSLLVQKLGHGAYKSDNIAYYP